MTKTEILIKKYTGRIQALKMLKQILSNRLNDKEVIQVNITIEKYEEFIKELKNLKL